MQFSPLFTTQKQDIDCMCTIYVVVYEIDAKEVKIGS